MKHKRIMLGAVALVVAVIILNACAPTERAEAVVVTKEVSVPVGEIFQPPAELKRTPLTGADMPQWIPPTDPRATSCVAPEGEAKVRFIGGDRESRLDGWEQWIR